MNICVYIYIIIYLFMHAKIDIDICIDISIDKNVEYSGSHVANGQDVHFRGTWRGAKSWSGSMRSAASAPRTMGAA